MTIFNIIALAGGIGMFLYGMTIMGNGLEKVAGNKTEAILRRLTSSTWKGVLLGTAITALIQSSAGTTVVVIGMVNSGVMTLTQGVGVVMGANIGTTVTGQILRLAAISDDNFFMQFLKPTNLGAVMVFIGAILYVFFKSSRKKNVGQIMVGFGVLFAGMNAMTVALKPLENSPLFAKLFSSLTNPFLGVLAGIVVTALIQSSSASVGLLQALSTTGVVTWGSAIPIVFGQNIGTTSTGLMASAGASRAARRVAVVHLYFNVIGTALFMGVIYLLRAVNLLPFAWTATMDINDIANFHTFFNLITTIIFIPFAWVLVRLAEWTVPDKPGEGHPELEATILDERLYNSPAVAIGQARKAVEQMGTVGRMIQRDAMPLLLKHDQEKILLAEQRESVIDKLDVTVSNYLVNLTTLELSEAESREVSMLLNFVTEFERMGDYAINVVQRSGEVLDKEIHFSESAQRELMVLSDAVGEAYDITLQAFIENDIMAARRVEPIEETVDVICEMLRARHIERLKAGSCTIEGGIVFLEVLNDYERISDHCSNIAARMISVEMEADGFDPHALRRDLHEGRLDYYNEMAQEYEKKYLSQLAEDGSPEEEQNWEQTRLEHLTDRTTNGHK